MRTKRLLAPLTFGALLVVSTGPALAQSADSSTEALIRGLNAELLAVAIPITLIVEGILVYTVWKYRNSEEALPTLENRRLEITWTVTTALVLLFVGIASYGVLAQHDVTATQATAQQTIQQDNTVLVEAHGHQWYWVFNYPEQNVSVRGQMVVPADRQIVIRTASSDVIHSFHAPELGLKADAIPGQYNYMQTKIYQQGTYQIYCAEYCGALHSQMLAKMHVVSNEKYEQWIQDPQNVSVTSGAGGSANASA